MLRGVPLALWCLMAMAAAPAHAIGPAEGVAQVTGTPSAQPALQTRYVGVLGVEVVDQPTPPLSVPRQRYERQASVAASWPKERRSGVAVALTEGLRVGFRYRYLEGEDLWPEFADTGATDYESHHLLIRASWRF
jgi:hypothetical protein